MKIFAYECFADKDIFRFLTEKRCLPLEGRHSFGQGTVINHVFNHEADIGMVDEDPKKPHHKIRDEMKLVCETANVKLLRKDGRAIVLVRPELEESFLASMNAVGLTSRLGSDPKTMRDELGRPRNALHEVFYKEIEELYLKSNALGASTLITELETVVKKAMSI